MIKRRVADLRALGQEQLKRHLHTRIGGHDMLLIETGGKGHLSGFEKAVLCPGMPLSLFRNSTISLASLSLSHCNLCAATR